MNPFGKTLLIMCAAVLCGSSQLAQASPPPSLFTSLERQTLVTHGYDPTYRKIPYPGGDVGQDSGVCSDVVIRAFRAAGLDLQRLVHEDMRRNFSAYPRIWGLSGPDTNIDHRRVPNLMTFFKRKGKALGLSSKGENFLPGDIVAWRLPNGLHHIGLISDRKVAQGGHYLVVHNIGAGTRYEDILFQFTILGHYRYFSPSEVGTLSRDSGPS